MMVFLPRAAQVKDCGTRMMTKLCRRRTVVDRVGAHLRKVDLHQNMILPLVTCQRREVAIQVPAGC